MQLICPNCGARIAAEEVNVQADLARCSACNEVFKASRLVGDADLSQSLEPPAGSKIEFEADQAGNASFHIPRRRLRGSDVFPMIFAAFWVGFMAFWTWVAASAGGFFA
ncbi:MAG: hypothetical protein GTN78_04160, partial [Gemmatimonadales bacterium]|nr:hypothetical protein [Gemmatimonadales bacterium]